MSTLGHLHYVERYMIMVSKKYCMSQYCGIQVCAVPGSSSSQPIYNFSIYQLQPSEHEIDYASLNLQKNIPSSCIILSNVLFQRKGKKRSSILHFYLVFHHTVCFMSCPINDDCMQMLNTKCCIRGRTFNIQMEKYVFTQELKKTAIIFHFCIIWT